jgi:hypothetical protein
MASHALALYQAASSPYNLERDLSFTQGDLEREKTQTMSITPLASLPPPASYGSSEGDSLKSTASTRPPFTGAKVKAAPPRRPMTGAIGIKRPATDIGGPSKRPASTFLGNTSSTSSFHTAKASLSHTLMGIYLPNGGRGKGFVLKATLPKVPAKTTSSAPLRIPRKNLRKAPNVVESKSSGAPLPTLIFLMSRVDAVTSIIERLESDLEKKEAKNAQLVEGLNKLRLSFHTKLARIVRAVGVEYALTLSK